MEKQIISTKSTQILHKILVFGIFVLALLLGIYGCETEYPITATSTDPLMSASILNNPQFKNAKQNSDKLAVIWYSDDPNVAKSVCLMYTHAAKTNGWFNEVKLIVWGPSQKLLVENSELQATVTQMLSDGVSVEACRACADMYDVVDELEALGITVKYMGNPLTDMLQSGWSTLTF